MSQDELTQPQQQRPDIQVIIPYRQLEDLLQAGTELKALRAEVKRLKEQNARVRGMLYEIMLKVDGKD